MNALALTFILISALFALALAVKAKTGKSFCAICAAISLSWITLLALQKAGWFGDKTLVALLIGQSITGVYYLAESKAGRELGVFRLAFLLTLIFFGYLLVGGKTGHGDALMVLVDLWIVLALVYTGKKGKKLGALAKRLIECCKNW